MSLLCVCVCGGDGVVVDVVVVDVVSAFNYSS